MGRALRLLLRVPQLVLCRVLLVPRPRKVYPNRQIRKQASLLLAINGTQLAMGRAAGPSSRTQASQHRISMLGTRFWGRRAKTAVRRFGQGIHIVLVFRLWLHLLLLPLRLALRRRRRRVRRVRLSRVRRKRGSWGTATSLYERVMGMGVGSLRMMQGLRAHCSTSGIQLLAPLARIVGRRFGQGIIIALGLVDSRVFEYIFLDPLYVNRLVHFCAKDQPNLYSS